MQTQNVRADKRWRGERPRVAPASMWHHLVDRKHAGELAGVTDRTITRWADSGILTKYLDGRGRVRFDGRACEKLRDPDDGA